MRKRLLSLLILLLFSSSILAVINLNTTKVSAVEYPAIYIEPASTVDANIKRGDNYTISVKTNYTGDDIQGYQFHLSYDPDVLHGGINKTDTWSGDGGNATFFTTKALVVPDSEKVYVNQTLLEKSTETSTKNYTIDYKIVYGTGEITFFETTNMWTGDGGNTTFVTNRTPVAPDSEKVYLNKVLRTKPEDYTIDYGTGEITFTAPPPVGAKIEVIYNVPPGLGAEIKAIYLYGGLANGDLITIDKHPSVTFLPGTFDNTAGELPLTAAFFFFIVLPAPLTSGPGTLATVDFTVVGRGDFNITLGNATKLIGYTDDGWGDPHDIIHAETMPNNIGHSYFDNTKPIHDVAVTSIVAPTTTTLGKNVSIDVTVANEGNSTETLNVTVYANTTDIGTQHVSDLISGNQTTLTFIWNTEDLNHGNYTLTANATVLASVDNPGGIDEDPSNNEKSTLIELEPVHDVAIPAIAPYGNESVEQRAHATVGDIVPINITVANEGHYTENVNFTVSYIQRRGPSEKIIIYNATENFTLKARTSQILNFSWDTTGLHTEEYYWYMINATATVLNSTENPKGIDKHPDNNNNATHIQLKLGHDVEITRITPFPTSVFMGKLMNIEVALENDGAHNETLSLKVSYNTTIFKEFQQIELPTGNQTILSFNWNTTGVAPGSYVITAEAILAEGIVDVNPDNNLKSSSLVDVKLPLGAIAGTVTDALTENPIPGATVIAGDYTNTTDAEGQYSIADVLAGTYDVIVYAEGYESSSLANINVTAGETTTLNFTLTSLPTTGTITGNVTDSSTGDAIADATVTINGMSAATNSSGAYIISNVPPGNYTVTASKDGYESSTKTVLVVAGETTPVDFELTPVQPLNILLYAGVAAIAIIIIATITVYILKIRKPK